MHTKCKLSLNEIARLQFEFSKGCPVKPWPLGSPTSLNPLVAVLGVSPGDSPSVIDERHLTSSSIGLPTAGVPHPDIYYKDSKGYWDKVRMLGLRILSSKGFDDNDALSLFANLNLDDGNCGQAKNVTVDPRYASWILTSIRDKLRPKFLICLGMKNFLEKNSIINSIFSNTFDGYLLKKPKREWLFEAYSHKKQLKFREWDIDGPEGNSFTLVIWPQHPSRSPMTNSDVWRASCEEFYNKHFKEFI